MSYLDSSDAQLIALTRLRREEARALMDYLRQQHEHLRFYAIPKVKLDPIEAAWREPVPVYRLDWPPPHVEWKRYQWSLGYRKCGYCRCHMTLAPNTADTCTVDHRKALALGGKDEEANWILACSWCNTRKGVMTEEEFRKGLAKMILGVR